MSDRLAELRRQRALVEQHLAWLDREIAAETARLSPAEAGAKIAAVVTAAKPAATPSITKPIIPAPAMASVTPAVTPPANPEADRILEEFHVAPATVHEDVRKGCFLYFAAALAIFAAIIALLYFTIPRKEIRRNPAMPSSEENVIATPSSPRSNEKR
jgi:hypothetical protein